MMINTLIDPHNLLIRVCFFFTMVKSESGFSVLDKTIHTACQLLHKAAAQKPSSSLTENFQHSHFVPFRSGS